MVFFVGIWCWVDSVFSLLSVSVIVPSLLILGFWLWFSNNSESFVLKSSNFISLEVLQWLVIKWRVWINIIVSIFRLVLGLELSLVVRVSVSFSLSFRSLSLLSSVIVSVITVSSSWLSVSVLTSRFLFSSFLAFFFWLNFSGSSSSLDGLHFSVSGLNSFCYRLNWLGFDSLLLLDLLDDRYNWFGLFFLNLFCLNDSGFRFRFFLFGFRLFLIVGISFNKVFQIFL